MVGVETKPASNGKYCGKYQPRQGEKKSFHHSGDSASRAALDKFLDHQRAIGAAKSE